MVYDSFSHKSDFVFPKQQIQHFQKYLKKGFKSDYNNNEWKTKVGGNIPTQHDSICCGVYTCLICEHIVHYGGVGDSKRIDLNFQKYTYDDSDMVFFRLRMLTFMRDQSWKLISLFNTVHIF